MIDVEADGPVPGLYSMVSLGAVIVEPTLDRRFLTNLRPISDRFQNEALAISGATRETSLEYPEAEESIKNFNTWLLNLEEDRITCASDNNGFDWSFLNYYMHRYLGANPLGYQTYHLPSVYAGCTGEFGQGYKDYRITPHTHNPLDDAIGNAEAMLSLAEQYNLNLGI